MKKIIVLLWATVMVLTSVFALSSCMLLDATIDLQRVKDNGVFKVGMECDYQPFNWTQNDNSNGAVPIANISGQFASGFDVSVAKKIAQDLGVKLEIHKIEWGSLVPALEAGAIDAIIAGMSPTPERKETLDFSSNYYQSNLVVVVRTNGNFASASSLTDLAGAKIAAQRGTIHAKMLAQIINPVPASLLLDEFTDMIAALQAGTIEGYIAEEPGAIANCMGVAGFTYVPLENNANGFEVTDIDSLSLAAGLRKGSSLNAEISAIIDAFSQSDIDTLMLAAIENQPIAN